MNERSLQEPLKVSVSIKAKLQRLALTGTNIPLATDNEVLEFDTTFIEGLASDLNGRELSVLDTEFFQPGRLTSNRSYGALHLCARFAADENVEIRKKAVQTAMALCREARHILIFIILLQEYRGIGRLIRNSIRSFYRSLRPAELMIELQNKPSLKIKIDGKVKSLTHRHLLASTRIRGSNTAQDEIFNMGKGFKPITRPPEFMMSYYSLTTLDLTHSFCVSPMKTLITSLGVEYKNYPENIKSSCNASKAFFDAGLTDGINLIKWWPVWETEGLIPDSVSIESIETIRKMYDEGQITIFDIATLCVIAKKAYREAFEVLFESFRSLIPESSPKTAVICRIESPAEKLNPTAVNLTYVMAYTYARVYRANMVIYGPDNAMVIDVKNNSPLEFFQQITDIKADEFASPAAIISMLHGQDIKNIISVTAVDVPGFYSDILTQFEPLSVLGGRLVQHCATNIEFPDPRFDGMMYAEGISSSVFDKTNMFLLADD